MHACAAGSFNIVKTLVAEGADPTAEDEAGWTALEHALCSSKSSTPIIRALIKAGAKPQPEHLLVAISKKKAGAIKAFIETGVSPEGSPEGCSWPLARAASVGYLPTIIALVKSGADVNRRSIVEGETRSILTFASDLRVMDFLFEAGARVSPDDLGLNLTERGNDWVLRAHRLLQFGAVPNEDEAISLLEYAVANKDVNLAVRILPNRRIKLISKRHARKSLLARNLPSFLDSLRSVRPPLCENIFSETPELEAILAKAALKNNGKAYFCEAGPTDLDESELPSALRPGAWPVTPLLPAYWNIVMHPLPRLKDGRPLPAHAIENLVRILRASNMEEQHGALEEVLLRFDRRSLGDFAWSFFLEWNQKGTHDERWILEALAYFGCDVHAENLARYIREWPWARTVAIAKCGLDVLAKLGTEAALLQIQSIAIKIKYATLRTYASDLMGSIALARGTTVKALEGSLVPSLGLSETGCLNLDFGSRQFYARPDYKLQPCLFDDSGRSLKALPSQSDGDELDKVLIAREQWEMFRKGLKGIARLQLLRFEDDMVQRSGFSGTSFIEHIVNHRLLAPLVRSLVWGVFRGGGRLTKSFRITSQKTLLDLTGKKVTVRPSTKIRVVHPIDLAELRDAWIDVFKSEKLAQPFPQLVRVIYRVEDDKNGDHFGLQGSSVPTGAVRGLREKGWTGSCDAYGAWLECWRKCFGKHQVLVTFYPGVSVQSSSYDQATQELKVEDVSMLSLIEYSELMRDLHALRA